MCQKCSEHELIWTPENLRKCAVRSLQFLKTTCHLNFSSEQLGFTTEQVYSDDVLSAIPLRFQSFERKGTTGSHIFGETTYIITPQGNIVISGIQVKPGLPKQRVEALLVHEFTHAWLQLYRTLYLSKEENIKLINKPGQIGVEEGFCNYVSYTYHRLSKNVDYPIVRFWIHLLSTSPVQTYKKEFSNASTHIKKFGWTATLERLALHGFLD